MSKFAAVRTFWEDRATSKPPAPVAKRLAHLEPHLLTLSATSPPSPSTASTTSACSSLVAHQQEIESNYPFISNNVPFQTKNCHFAVDFSKFQRNTKNYV